MKHPVQAALFDIYGTLLISASGDITDKRSVPFPSEALRSLLKKYQLSMTPAHLTESLALAIGDAHRSAKRQGIDFPEVEIETLWQSILAWPQVDKVRAFAVEYELIVNPVWPMPGLVPLLAHIHGLGIPMGIISNAQFYTPLVFEYLLGATMPALGFDSRLLFFSHAYHRAKPGPLLFREAARRLTSMGIPPTQAVYMGNDIRNDILGAREVGFQTVLFAGDARSLRLRANDPHCIGVAPDLVITTLPQLSRHLTSSPNHPIHT